jgi:hypothetical protein
MLSRPADPAGQKDARVAELVDALDSGSSGGNPVEVRVLSRAPSDFQGFPKSKGSGIFCIGDRGVPTVCLILPPLNIVNEKEVVTAEQALKARGATGQRS